MVAKKLFISRYPQLFCNIALVCREVGISRFTFYEWMKTDPSFATAIQEGQEEYYDALETKLGQNALQRDKEVSLIFALKNLRPWKWKDNPTPIMGFQNVTIIHGHRNGELTEKKEITIENAQPVSEIETADVTSEPDTYRTVWKKGRRIAIPTTQDAEVDS